MLKRTSLISAAFILLTVVLFTSCDSKKVFDGNTKIPDNLWTSDNVIKLAATVTDASTPANILINVRHAQSYPFGNLLISVTMQSPDGKISQDTLNCQLADSNKWRGDGLGDYWDYSVPYKQNVQLQKGTYTFSFKQLMPEQKLPLIMAMGVRIEKTK